jgi:hypothetical protein
MNADGSDKTKTIPLGAGIGTLSREEHGSHYWWIGYKAIDGQTYPDGQPRRELLAVRDDNTKSVQLTNDATMGFSQYCRDPIWGFGDGFISWAAKSWIQQDSTWVIDESGIYKQSIAFDSNGDVTGLTGTASLVYDPGLLYLEGENFYMIDSDTHNWAPGNTKIVNCEQDGDMYIIDLTQPTGSQETFLTNGWEAEYSPDGTKIAFIYQDDLCIINHDGTGKTVLVQDKDSKAWFNFIDAPAWSPDSMFLSYLERGMSFKGGYSTRTSIYVIGVDGKGDSCLTNDLSIGQWKFNREWR